MHSQQLIQLPEIYSQPIVTNHQHFQQSFRPHSIQRRQLTQNLQQVFLQLGEGIPMQCGICCQFVNSRLFEYFCCSSHQFCKTCVLAVLHENLNNFTISKCPEADCLAEFNQNSPFYGQLTAFHKKKFTKIRNNRQALSKPNIKLCRNEQCDGLVSTEKLQCSFCLQKHCQICFQIQHNGKCDKQIKSGLNRKYKFNRCPNCRMMVEKSNGCAHISCICGCQFCYFCGDVFSSSHACKDKLKGGMLSKVRSYVGNQNDEINKVINCSRILEFFEPDIDRSAPLRYLELVLAFALYPFVNGICLTLAIAAAVIYLLVATSIGILFFVFLALLEVVNLQLAPSRYLQQKGLPNWLIRILVIPMFPLNLFFGIKSKCNYVFGNTSDFDKVKVILKPMLFFLLLPCLLVEERQDSQFQ